MTRTITTAAELDALPVESVIKAWTTSRSGRPIFVRQPDGWFPRLRDFETMLPATVLYDPSAPAPAPSVVPEAAIDVAANAVRRSREFTAGAAFGIPLDATDTAASALARAALTAALPLMTAAPSATRDEVAEAVLADVIDEQLDVEGPTVLARRLLARFAITPKEDR